MIIHFLSFPQVGTDKEWGRVPKNASIYESKYTWGPSRNSITSFEASKSSPWRKRKGNVRVRIWSNEESVEETEQNLIDFKTIFSPRSWASKLFLFQNIPGAFSRLFSPVNLFHSCFMQRYHFTGLIYLLQHLHGWSAKRKKIKTVLKSSKHQISLAAKVACLARKAVSCV